MDVHDEVTEVKIFRCSPCNVTFLVEEDFLKHNLFCLEENNRCDSCNEEFDGEAELLLHVKHVNLNVKSNDIANLEPVDSEDSHCLAKPSIENTRFDM